MPEAVLAATFLFSALAVLIGAALPRFAASSRFDRDRLIGAIDARLPQTQCTQCGHPGCRPYAIAIADGAQIDLCPPGGEPLVRTLAALLGRRAPGPNADVPARPADEVAVIDEARCIGCALCLPACPTDAIVGSPQLMHTVIAADCTGCRLCLPPCPVDCIRIEPRGTARTIEAAPAIAQWPCIHCGDCARACPVELRPDLLHVAGDDSPAALTCIECGACDAACPSGIRLSAAIAGTKRRVDEAIAMATRADRARERYVAHEARFALVQSSALERREARIKRRLTARPSSPDAR